MTGRGPLLGWNIEAGSDETGWTFVRFIPAPDLDGKLSMLADLTVLEIEGSQPGGGRVLSRAPCAVIGVRPAIGPRGILVRCITFTGRAAAAVPAAH